MSFRTPARWIALLAALLIGCSLAAVPSAAEEAGGAPTVPRLDARLLSTGDRSSCVVVSSGELRCWGYNANGQLGQGDTLDVGDTPGESSVPVYLGQGGRATAVSQGLLHACAITDLGSLRCWGRNNEGQLGLGNTLQIGDEPTESTAEVNLPGTATAITLGWVHSCAIVNATAVRCWGDNARGQLGQGNTDRIGDDPGESTVPVDLGPSVTPVAIDAGGYHNCVIGTDGQLRCWGRNNVGQLGQGNTNTIGDNAGERPALVNLGAGRLAVAVAAGYNHTCAINDLGQLLCWGDNFAGELGQGNVDSIGDAPGEVPAPVDLGLGRKAIAVSAGGYNTCAITDLGQLRCWGSNLDGQLGQGNTLAIGDNPGETTVPVDLGPGRTAVAVSVGESHVCAALDDRTVRCWGQNTRGTLGQGSTVGWGRNPGEVPGALPAIKLGGSSFGRDSDGDGVRDAVDECPAVSAGTANGCAAPTSTPTPSPTPTPSETPTPTPTAVPTPTTTPTPTPTPTPIPEVTLQGKTLRIKTFLRRQVAKAGCPAKAKVVVKVSGKIASKTRLKTRAKTKNGDKGCQVKGKVKLAKSPATTAKVTVTIRGKNLKTKKLRAVRA